MTTATALPPRLAYLRSLVISQGGEWTPARVERAYETGGWGAPKHSTHKADLKRLWHLGVLDRRDEPGRTYYVPARQTHAGGIA